MIERVGVAEARKRFGVLLDRVTSGETVEITRRGRPVARLIPVQPAFDSEKARRAAESIIENAKGVTLGGLKIKDLINEGRR